MKKMVFILAVLSLLLLVSCTTELPIEEVQEEIIEEPKEMEMPVPGNEDVEEMITLCHVQGTLLYMDDDGNTVGYDDVHTKIELCRTHFDKVGLGADYVEQFVR